MSQSAQNNVSPCLTSPALNEQERIARIQLYRSKNIGPVTYRSLLSRYGSAIKALAHLPTLPQHNQGRPFKAKHAFEIYPRDAVLHELDLHHKHKAHLIVEGDPDYPQILQSLADAPPILSIKGNLALLNQKAVSIVGARNCSLNGRKLAYQFAQHLGEAGYSIVSGLARGIDTQAHLGSLNTGTLAVIAGGIDQIYPPENAKLFAEIVEKGLLIAETEIGIEPQSTFFPRRNRLISGLSCGVLIIEAALQSGSLTTARYAYEQNREVFVIPGSPLDPRYAGSNKLLKSGAQLVTEADDILETLEEPYHQALTQAAKPLSQILTFDFAAPTSPAHPDQQPAGKQDQIQAEILNFLSSTPISLDELLRACSFPSSRIMFALLELELAGKAIRHPGNMIST
jgi:DNA protecting protein DprA